MNITQKLKLIGGAVILANILIYFGWKYFRFFPNSAWQILSVFLFIGGFFVYIIGRFLK